MRAARETVPLSVMRRMHSLERKLLMTLFSRKHPPKGLLLLELWTTHDGLIYLRYAATGSMHMNFVTETCAWRTKFVISDCIANEIDFTKLAQGS